MTRRKKDMGKHVSLADETVKKLMATAQPVSPKFIDPWDLLVLERADAQVAQCTLQEQRHRNHLLQLDIQRAQYEQEAKALTDARVKAMSRAQELAAEVAARYELDWQTHAYNPETGEVTRAN